MNPDAPAPGGDPVIPLIPELENPLVADGFHPNSLLENRHKVRGFLFYPRGTSHNTYFDHVKSIDLYGTRASIPYL